MTNLDGALWRRNHEYGYWYLEGVVYCENPQVPELQCMNFYLPEQYRNQDGSWNLDGVCGKYSFSTAPIIFENSVGGYSESHPLDIQDPHSQGLSFIKEGMVYVTPGTRGKQTRDASGRWIGKAPEGLVDLKCAVRFLRHCRGKFPGDTERIISVGMSAGGAMSSLLGVTGNHTEYLPYLEAAGAVMEEKDSVYAAQCYCPIIDLEHGNMAYEWMFDGTYSYRGKMDAGQLDSFRQALSQKLARRYVRYFNDLDLTDPDTGRKLIFTEDGKAGPAMEYLMHVLNKAAGRWCCHSLKEKQLPEDMTGWVSWNGTSAELKNLESMKSRYLERIKTCTAFDSLENTQSENQEFGDEQRDFVHFDPAMGEILEELREEFPDEYEKYKKAFAGIAGDEVLCRRIRLMNPFSFIGTGQNTDMARYFRIRVGTKDAHTSFTMAMILALKLQNAGAADTDYAMVWNAGHEKADEEGEFIRWVERIV